MDQKSEQDLESETPKSSNPVFVGSVLIVDDSEDNLTLLGHYLKNLNIHSESVNSGKEAIARALRHPYDLILLDIQMPDLDGYEVVQLLRLKNYTKPVVALTAHAMKGDRKKCLEAGFTDYLSKPIDKIQLTKILTLFLKQKDK
jgi:CheY-like chemotaxis protein